MTDILPEIPLTPNRTHPKFEAGRAMGARMQILEEHAWPVQVCRGTLSKRSRPSFAYVRQCWPGIGKGEVTSSDWGRLRPVWGEISMTRSRPCKVGRHAESFDDRTGGNCADISGL